MLPLDVCVYNHITSADFSNHSRETMFFSNASEFLLNTDRYSSCDHADTIIFLHSIYYQDGVSNIQLCFCSYSLTDILIINMNSQTCMSPTALRYFLAGNVRF